MQKTLLLNFCLFFMPRQVVEQFTITIWDSTHCKQRDQFSILLICNCISLNQITLYCPVSYYSCLSFSFSVGWTITIPPMPSKSNILLGIHKKSCGCPPIKTFFGHLDWTDISRFYQLTKCPESELIGIVFCAVLC